VQQQAFDLGDFTCPLDQNPFVLQTGYRSSYQLASAFAGGRLLALEETRSAVLLSELGKRHKEGGVPTAVYLFADLHYETGGPDPNEPGKEKHLPGLRSRWYNQSANLTVPATESRRDLVWSEAVRCEPGRGLFFLPGAYYDSGWQAVADWDRSAATEPRRILGVWDGYLMFPQAGTWQLVFECLSPDQCYLEVEGQVAQGAGNQTLTVNLSQARKAFVEFRFLETGANPGDGVPNSYFRLYWTGPTVPRQPIPPRYFSHIPFEPTNVQN
jgi:hypothetical protein